MLPRSDQHQLSLPCCCGMKEGREGQTDSLLCCVLGSHGQQFCCGDEILGSEKKNQFAFFLKFLHFYHIIKYLQKKNSSGCLKNRAEGLKWSMLLYLSPL